MDLQGVIALRVGLEPDRHCVLPAHVRAPVKLEGQSEHKRRAFTYSFIGGIHHLRLFRRTGQQQQGRRPNERDRGMDFAALLAIVFVLIGTVKAVRSLYRFIQRQSFKMLSRVEDTILEVNA
jgi:hypothetical protein